MQIVEYQRPIFAIFKLHDFFIILLVTHGQIRRLIPSLPGVGSLAAVAVVIISNS
jgi:hypothetical protein